MIKLFKKFNRFEKDQGGSFAITTALALPVSLLAVFGALDYGMYVTSKQELKTAASVAALAAINDAHIAYNAKENVNLEDLVRSKAKDTFIARASKIKKTDITNVIVTPSIQNNQFTVDVTYKAKVSSLVASLTGQDTYSIADKQRARISVRSYINFNFLFDVSASMGVGATQADMELLFETNSCALSCHIDSNFKETTYDRGRAAGATMRIDVAREAATEALNLIEANAETPDHMTVGMHIYDNRARMISDYGNPEASDFDFLRNRLADVQMDPSHGGSNLAGSLVKVVNHIPESGSGRTPDDRVQYLIILTDGIENTVFANRGTGDGLRKDGGGWDYYVGDHHNTGSTYNDPHFNSGWHQKVHAPLGSSCDAAKAKGIGVFFINTEYIVPPVELQGHGSNGDPRFEFIESTLHDVTQQRMVECAGSENSVIKSSTPDEIIDAFKTIIGGLSSPLRLY